jgi:hypothetical protein
VRWPPKPPPDTRCDSYRLIGPDSLDIGRCPNTAVETVVMKKLGHQAWFCADCVIALEAKDSIQRNPKRRQ